MDIINSLNITYGDAIAKGQLEIIVPPSDYYPDFESHLDDKIYGDSPERVKWRSKQNFDYAYLIRYAHNKGEFYLQVNDSLLLA
jgi:alpha-1,3-mannosylglycoprotein beta-1,4-N-acetylglucosaminyltransferase A/B